MGRLLRRISGIAAVALVSLTTLTGCVDTDGDWWGAPPYGYTYNDPRLEGYWALVQYNSDPVSLRRRYHGLLRPGASSPTAEHRTIRSTYSISTAVR